MILRKEAKLLLAEYLDQLAVAENEQGVDLDGEGLAAVARELLDRSDLVVSGRETVPQKAARYLTEGRLQIERMDRGGGLIVASCRGSGSTVHRLGYDPSKKEWRCTCPVVKGLCSHLVALQLVTAAVEGRDGG